MSQNGSMAVKRCGAGAFTSSRVVQYRGPFTIASSRLVAVYSYIDFLADPINKLMKRRYSYKIVRVGKALFETKKEARSGYAEVIEDNAAQGWRLVQVFAPGHGIYGAPRYYDLIFEMPAE